MATTKGLKYPGSFILNEYGSNKELAKSYGVSERTIYRWKNKAKEETGTRTRKPTRPRTSTLERFQGTRKELAKRYGVSERTAYRWLKQAKEKGANIPSRRKEVKYPGTGILDEDLKNKELAKKYNVSESTIKRWKRKALAETEPFEVLPPEETIEAPQPAETKPEADFYNELFGDSKEPLEVDTDLGDMFEIDTPDTVPFEEYSETYQEQISDILDTLDNASLINANSPFLDLDHDKQLEYIHEYIQFQWDENPYQFNQSPPDDPNGPDLSDPQKIANIDIWGDTFDSWVQNQILVDSLGQ